jgi:hypothetical protein
MAAKDKGSKKPTAKSLPAKLSDKNAKQVKGGMMKADPLGKKGL